MSGRGPKRPIRFHLVLLKHYTLTKNPLIFGVKTNLSLDYPNLLLISVLLARLLTVCLRTLFCFLKIVSKGTFSEGNMYTLHTWFDDDEGWVLEKSTLLDIFLPYLITMLTWDARFLLS